MSVEVRRVAGTDPVAVRLVAAMAKELGGLERSPLAPSALAPPDGGFVVVLSEDRRVVAGGGVRRLDERTGEIKRMYVVPEARGRGVGRQLLAALEELARDLGYAVVRLDTAAGGERIYERAGYVAVPDYNGNPYAAYWGEKRLAGEPAPGSRAPGAPGGPAALGAP